MAAAGAVPGDDWWRRGCDACLPPSSNEATWRHSAVRAITHKRIWRESVMAGGACRRSGINRKSSGIKENHRKRGMAAKIAAKKGEEEDGGGNIKASAK